VGGITTCIYQFVSR